MRDSGTNRMRDEQHLWIRPDDQSQHRPGPPSRNKDTGFRDNFPCRDWNPPYLSANPLRAGHTDTGDHWGSVFSARRLPMTVCRPACGRAAAAADGEHCSWRDRPHPKHQRPGRSDHCHFTFLFIQRPAFTRRRGFTIIVDLVSVSVAVEVA